MAARKKVPVAAKAAPPEAKRGPVKWDGKPVATRSLTGRTIATVVLNERGAGMFTLIREGRTVQRIDWSNVVVDEGAVAGLEHGLVLAP